MPTNQLKKYNSLLDLLYPTLAKNLESLRKVFDRDISNNGSFLLRQKPIYPTYAEGEDKMDRLFRHLTTVVTDKATRKREFESERSVRLHWIKYHIDETKKEDILFFNVQDENRTYILDCTEKYLIVLEPLRNKSGYYLLSAHCLLPANFKKAMKKYTTRSSPIV